MAWTYGVYETATGRMVAPVQPSDCSWTRKLDNKGTGSFTFKVHDPSSYPGQSPQVLFMEDEHTIVAIWDDKHSAYAGVIEETAYDWGRGEITVQTREVRALFETRFTGRPDNYGPEGWDFLVDGTIGAGVQALAARATGHGPGYSLPIVPDDGPGAGGAWRREINYYEAITIEDLFQEAEALGCYIDFNPDLTADGDLVWVLVTALDLDRGVQPIVVGAPNSPVVAFSTRRSSMDRASGVIALGEGSGKDQQHGAAWGALGTVARDRTISLGDEKEPAQLVTAAQVEQAEIRNPALKWSLSLRMGGETALRPWLVRCGRTLEIHTPDDPYLIDGPRDKVVLSLSGDTSDVVTVEVTDPDDS